MAESEIRAPITNEQILAQLTKLAELGAVQYVLPTKPLGESWVVGIEGDILKMTTGEAIAFIAGTSAVTYLLARQRGISFEL